MLTGMSGLRVVIASYGAPQFRVMHAAVAGAGHVPVAYLLSRSLRSGGESSEFILNATRKVLDELPPGLDFLLPGGRDHLPGLLTAYQPDILLVFGFNWKLPREVLDVPRLGALNVHPSALPKYRGPSPLIWAVRNGDSHLGLTVHRMTERIDAGPVLAQATDIPLPAWVTKEEAWDLQAEALPALLATALDRAATGDPGSPQDEDAATYAAPPPGEWLEVSWDGTRLDAYRQIRLARFLGGDHALITLDGREERVARASLTDDGGIRVECGDGPLWVTVDAKE